LNPHVPDRNAAIAGAGPSPGPVLAAMAAGLEIAGAEGLVLVCNSAHAYEREIRAVLQRARFISLIDETVAAVRLRYPSARRIGLLAASACLEARLYQSAFSAADIEVASLDFARQTLFMQRLYQVKAGDVGDEVRAGMRELAEYLLSQGADLVVSGCTEVPLVLSSQDLERPLVDSTDVLVAAALTFARSG
jgi:aspartate racemase